VYRNCDGLVFHEHRLVYNTLVLQSGVDKWGAGNLVDGSRAILLCGPQALALLTWVLRVVRKMVQLYSSPGVNIDKMFGFLKPKFYSIYDKSVEDFGVLCVDHAI